MKAKKTRTPHPPTTMRDQYGADEAGRVCGRCYFYVYESLPPHIKTRRPAPIQVYQCLITHAEWPPETPACKLWRQAPKELLK